MCYTCTYASPLDEITLACDNTGDNLIGLWLQGQHHHGGTMGQQAAAPNNMPALKAATQWLNKYFAGKKPTCHEISLAPTGTAFRQEVWRILCEIPYGEVVTYGSIAKQMAAKMGKKAMSSQAVGGAVGHNPISIIIPCHRVIGTNGTLTGYAGGIGLKAQLLKLEGITQPKLITV